MEALQTYRELAQKNPEVYLCYVAAALNNLALLDRYQNRMEKARQELEGLEEALKSTKTSLKKTQSGCA